MKRYRGLIAGFCLFALVLLAAPPLTPTPETAVAETSAPKAATETTSTAVKSPDLTAVSAFLIDADTGRVLFEKDADIALAPASTTKIMTALLAFEAGNLDRKVTVPAAANDVPADSTRMPVYPGETCTLRDLVYGMMIKSGNDAANAIAALLDGQVSDFVGHMNRRAASLGLSKTQFKNPHGYPANGHVTTARDLATLTRHALANPAFRKLATQKSVTLSNGKSLSCAYALLDPDSAYYDARAFGIKTGYASAAGHCFVSAAQANGQTLIAVLMKTSKTGKWTDAKALFDYGFQA